MKLSICVIKCYRYFYCMSLSTIWFYQSGKHLWKHHKMLIHYDVTEILFEVN